MFVNVDASQVARANTGQVARSNEMNSDLTRGGEVGRRQPAGLEPETLAVNRLPPGECALRRRATPTPTSPTDSASHCALSGPAVQACASCWADVHVPSSSAQPTTRAWLTLGSDRLVARRFAHPIARTAPVSASQHLKLAHGGDVLCGPRQGDRDVVGEIGHGEQSGDLEHVAHGGMRPARRRRVGADWCDVASVLTSMMVTSRGRRSDRRQRRPLASKWSAKVDAGIRDRSPDCGQPDTAEAVRACYDQRRHDLVAPFTGGCQRHVKTDPLSAAEF